MWRHIFHHLQGEFHIWRAFVEKLVSDVAEQLSFVTFDSWEPSGDSLCEEPIGEREAGDSRPL